MLLDSEGNLKLTDFGIAKQPDNIDECTSSSGTHGYMAPEVYAKGHLHGRQADWFSMGVVLFEMLSGRRPYPRAELERAHKKAEAVKAARRQVKKGLMSRVAQDFVDAALELDPAERIGARGGPEEIKAHAFFESVDWALLAEGKVAPPFTPDTSTANFDTGAEEIQEAFGAVSSSKKKKTLIPVSEEDQANFEGYAFNTEFEEAWIEMDKRGEKIPFQRRHLDLAFLSNRESEIERDEEEDEEEKDEEEQEEEEDNEEDNEEQQERNDD